MGFFEKIFGTHSQNELKRIYPISSYVKCFMDGKYEIKATENIYIPMVIRFLKGEKQNENDLISEYDSENNKYISIQPQKLFIMEKEFKTIFFRSSLDIKSPFFIISDVYKFCYILYNLSGDSDGNNRENGDLCKKKLCTNSQKR